MKDLLNAIIGLPKMLSLEKIISGGITAMKIGTSTKVTIGVIGAIVAGFIGFQVVTHNNTQPKVKPTEKVTQKTVRPKPQPRNIIKSSKAKSTEKGLEQLSDEELKKALDFRDSLDEKSTDKGDQKKEDIQQRVAPETEVSEAKETPEIAVPREILNLFIAYNEIRDKKRALRRKYSSFEIESAKLAKRDYEIGFKLKTASNEEAKMLHREFKINRKRREELRPIVEEFNRKRLELREEFEQRCQEYGMSREEFFNEYEKTYRAWYANLNK